MQQRLLVVLLAGLVLCGTLPAAVGGQRDHTPTPTPSGDRIGWEDGYAADDPLFIDRSDGLSDKELDALLARTMARVEAIRHLEFTDDVSVEIVNRSTFERRERNRTVNASLRTFDNAKFEALFLVNESTDSVAVQSDNAGNLTLGYYSVRRESIVLVADGEGAAAIGEIRLAHELVHALQDEYFNLSRYNARTRDGRHAQDGLIEGDAQFVEHLYRSECIGGWTNSCLVATDDGEASVRDFGVYLMRYFPYSDGPVFVRQIYEQGGWVAVNAIYGQPPDTAEQVIHPDRYPVETPDQLSSPVMVGAGATVTPTAPDDLPVKTPRPRADTESVTSTIPAPTPTQPLDGTRSSSTSIPANASNTTDTPASENVTADPRSSNGTTTPTTSVETESVETPPASVSTQSRSGPPGTQTDVTGPTWHRVRPPGRPNYATLGEASIAVMFFDPGYESEGRESIIPPAAFFNRSGNELSTFDPFVYDHPPSDGWNGDRLDIWQNGANETAYVWQLAWDSAAEAEEFAIAYRQLLTFRGAERVDTRTFRISDGGFADAFRIGVTGKRVTIVNAPTTQDLGAFDTSEEASARTSADGFDETVDPDAIPNAPQQPGFGVGTAVVALVLSVLRWGRRSE